MRENGPNYLPKQGPLISESRSPLEKLADRVLSNPRRRATALFLSLSLVGGVTAYNQLSSEEEPDPPSSHTVTTEIDEPPTPTTTTAPPETTSTTIESVQPESDSNEGWEDLKNTALTIGVIGLVVTPVFVGSAAVIAINKALRRK